MYTKEYFELLEKLEHIGSQDPSLQIFQKPPEPEFPEHIEKDSQFNELGNKFSYKKFISLNQFSGVHVSIDGNSIGALNEKHGHLIGDEAIRFMFETVASLSKEFKVHAFRTAGDKAKVVLQTPEQAVSFVKKMESVIDESPVLAGTQHKVTVAVGIGYTPTQSEQALAESKDILGDMVNSSRVKKFQLGKEPFVYVSKLHEAPPENWKPLDKSRKYLDQIVPRGLKLQHPLK